MALPDGRTVEYTIDPLGRRIAKSVNGVVQEKYLWQGMTRLLAVYDGSDLLKYRFQYAGGRMPVSVATDGTTYYLHYDQVGSLVALTGTDGGILKRVTYDSFGNILSDTKPAFSVLGFAGGLCDSDTGLVRFGYRDYDPETGRWTSKDPIGFDGGDADLYGYCGWDPVNWVDEFGLETAVIIGRGTSSNPFGHVAIAYTGQGVYSYGTGTFPGTSLTDYLASQAAYRDSTVYILPSTSNQEALMKDKIMEYDGKKLPDPLSDPLDPLQDTCATRTQSALDVGGFPSDLPFISPLPGDTEFVASRNSISRSDIPKGELSLQIYPHSILNENQMIRVLILLITIITAGCDILGEDNEQAKYELLNKHDYSVIQVLGYKYRNKTNNIPYLILLDQEDSNDNAVAFPIKGKTQGYVVILANTDFPPLIKYLPEKDFVVTQEAYQAVKSQLSLSKEVDQFIMNHMEE